MPAGHNDWGFFCDYFTPVVAPSRRSARPSRSGEQALRRGGYTDRHLAGPGRSSATASEQVTEDLRRTTTSGPLPIAVVAAGHRPGAGDGGQPALQPGRQPGRAGELPEHRQPADRRRRRRSTATRPARRSSCSPCWPRWSPGCRWPPGSTRRPGCSPGTRSTGTAQLRRLLVPGATPTRSGWTATATMWDGFGRSVNTYFVWLTEQVGADKVVEMAQRLGIVLPGRRRRRAGPRRRAGLGLVHPRRGRHHPAGPGQRVRHGGRRGDLLRAAAGGLGHRRGRPAGGRRRAGLPAGARRRRGPGGDRRGPLPGRRAVDVPGSATAAPPPGCDRSCGRPVAGKTGSSERNATETFVAFTPQLAVAAIAANPDDPRDAVGRRCRRR